MLGYTQAIYRQGKSYKKALKVTDIHLNNLLKADKTVRSLLLENQIKFHNLHVLKRTLQQ